MPGRVGNKAKISLHLAPPAWRLGPPSSQAFVFWAQEGFSNTESLTVEDLGRGVVLVQQIQSVLVVS